MASKGGPKPRKARKGSAAKRALRSLPAAQRKVEVDAAMGRRPGITRAVARQDVGADTRRSRLAAGKNPNTGKRGGAISGAIYAAYKKGFVSRGQANKALKTISSSWSKGNRDYFSRRAGGAAATDVLQAGHVYQGKGRRAVAGRALVNYAASTRKSQPKPAATTTTSSKPKTGKTARTRKVGKVAAKVKARAAASGKYAAPMAGKSARKQARKIIKGRK